ncbi:MAG: DUF6702 family protein [Putridiphycobacter sp.]|nr:DUF6702 family protein [Putridiphycobacter sp.]
MKRLLSLMLVLMSVLPAFAHKHYISIANMAYNASAKQIEVSLQVTAHDFEHILENHFKKRIEIETVSDSSEVGRFMIAYLNKNIQLKSANNSAKFNYVGKEVNVRDQLFFYFTFTEVLDPSHIILENSILFQLFSKQQNIAHYKFKEATKSITCTSQSPVADIKF